MQKILYVRSGPYQINLDSYNSQELGLATAFAELGIQCDILYYHKKKNFDQIVQKQNHEIKILWRKGIRLLRSGIYPQILKKKVLVEYDAVIVSEYSQIMSVLISRLHSNVFVYNGPYYNLFKLPFLEKIYDFLFVKTLNNRIRHFFCKTQMSMEYLQGKGIKNCSVIGVGLDPEKFEKENYPDENTKHLLSLMEMHRNLLYVGSVSERKNVDFLIKVFNELKKKNECNDLQLVIVGKSESGFWDECKKNIEPHAEKFIVYIPFIKNAQLKFIYEKSDVFVLPSKQEIFGMVLLESMYFGKPAVASASAGAKTLIENGICGIIVDDFDVNLWQASLENVLRENISELGKRAEIRIKNNFLWDGIAASIISTMENVT